MFGPDGMLYLGIGDGGGGGDPQNNGQNINTLLGKLLRIDVTNLPYTSPASNPFAGATSGRDEIWAYGLRNPWRYSFDAAANQLYIADVGQGAWEEVNAVATSAAGVNYGWRIMEGAHCYNAQTCNTTGLTQPVLEYDHSQGCSITGGFVYRGAAIPELAGHYLYSDYCSGFLRSFRLSGSEAARSEDMGGRSHRQHPLLRPRCRGRDLHAFLERPRLSHREAIVTNSARCRSRAPSSD